MPVQAATLQFSPPTATLTQGCYNSIDINIDVTGEVSNAADIEITYDPTQINIIDSDPNIAGTQIRPGNAYEAYFSNRVNTSTGQILLAAGSFVGTLNSSRILATIEMTAPAVTTSSFTIRFEGVGATLDSNIADASTSNDLLTSVTNGAYTFTSGSCVTDSQPPQAQLVEPQPYESNVPADSNIVVRVTDNQSGIDLSSLSFIINGVTYSVGDPQVTYTGNPQDYTFTIDPVDDLPNEEASTVGLSGRDLAGNEFSQQFVFNLPPEVVPPGSPGSGTVCEVPNPTSQAITSYIQSISSNPVVNLLTTTGFSLGFLQALTVLNTPGLFYNFLAFFLGKKRDKTWGTVTDSVTGKPIPFAACRLFIENTLSVQQQTVSDTEGRYGFNIQPGSYRLEVKQSGYETCTRSITIAPNESSHVYDVKLNPEDLRQSYAPPMDAFWDRLKNLYFKLRNYIFFIGLALAVFSVVVAPITLNIIIFIFYSVILIFLVGGYLSKKPKSAAVVDSQTNLRIPFAQVKIFDPKSWELIDSQVTNSNGNFDYWGKPGEYALLVDLRGYTFPSGKQRNYPVVKDKYSPMLKISLTQGYNNIQIYVDPVESSTFQNGTNSATPTAATNLSTPFG
jgi:hypothetical protein